MARGIPAEPACRLAGGRLAPPKGRGMGLIGGGGKVWWEGREKGRDMPTGHRFTYWKGEDGVFVGFPEEFPDYWTQGATLEELRENIADLLKDLTGGLVPCARHSEELVLG